MDSMTTKCLIAAATLAGAASPAGAHIIPFFAALDGQQVVPQTDSLATGACSMGYNHHAFTIEIKLYLEGISLDDLKNDGPNSTPIHIHKAPVGENGPIVIDLGWWTTTTLEEYAPNRIFAHWQGVFIGGVQGNVESDFIDNENAFYDGTLYVDVHTNAYPGGEVRGQIYPVPAPASLALLGAAGLIASRRRAR
ncbi:MAG: CHRD domain-containing protein [Phycisphaerales bacterium]|nr:CHRD domain-containing protein [Phycisphaerales bacterium]